MFANLRIGTRLGLSFAVLLCLLGVMTWVASKSMSGLADASRAFVEEDVYRVQLASEVNLEAQGAALVLLAILATSDREARIPLYTRMDARVAKLDSLLETLTDAVTPSQKALLETVVKARSTYKSAFLETVDWVEIDPKQAISQFHKETQPALNALLSASEKLLVQQNDDMAQKQLLAEKNSLQDRQLLWFIAVVAILAGAGLAGAVSAGIVGPLKVAVQQANNIANGDLTQKINPEGQSEIAQLLGAFATMNGSLVRLISEIQTTVVEVGGSVDAVNNTTGTVEQVSRKQVEAVTRIAEAVRQFAVDCKGAAIAASSSITQAESARDLAKNGKALILRASAEFGKISQAIADSASAVETLRERSVSVRNLVTTVREIAEQTNLLALNAAIEAARAGDSGRGFSVVADEVRILAVRTGQATEEINGVIDAMDRETLDAVKRISEGRDEMGNGVALINEMVSPLTELSDSAEKALSVLKDLEHSVEEQSRSSAVIEQDVHQIDAMAQENELAAHQVADTAQSLDALSQSLSQKVKEFSLP